MEVLENYNMRYNFGNQNQERISNYLNSLLNGSNNLFAKQLEENKIVYVRQEYSEMLAFINHVEEYLYYYKDDPNFNSIFKSISDIKKISVLPPDSRGIYGQAIPQENTLLINPNLHKSSTLTHEERRRLYVAHELGHFVNNKWMETVIKFLDIQVRDGALTQNEGVLIQEGFSMLDEAITQNNAENFAYKFAGKLRPNQSFRASNCGVFGNKAYSSNYDFYGEFQEPASKFAKTLRGIGKYGSDDIALDLLSKRALSPTFAIDIMDEYDKDNQYSNFLSLVKNMGVMKKAVYTSFGADDSISSIQLSEEVLNNFNALASRMRDFREPVNNNVYTNPQMTSTISNVGNTTTNRSTTNSAVRVRRTVSPQNISNSSIRAMNQNPGLLSKSISKAKEVIKSIKDGIKER